MKLVRFDLHYSESYVYLNVDHIVSIAPIPARVDGDRKDLIEHTQIDVVGEVIYIVKGTADKLAAMLEKG